MDCYSAFTLIFFFCFLSLIFFYNHSLLVSLSFFFQFFSHLYIFFYNQDLWVNLSTPPLLPGPNLFSYNRDIQVSLGTPRLIIKLIYYFLYFFHLYIFLWTWSPIQLKRTMTNSRTDFFLKQYELLQCFHAYIFLKKKFTYIFFYNRCLRANLSLFFTYIFFL